MQGYLDSEKLQVALCKGILIPISTQICLTVSMKYMRCSFISSPLHLMYSKDKNLLINLLTFILTLNHIFNDFS